MSQLIRSITLKSGPQGPSEPLTFEPGSVTLFVGPNHSGKSKLLQELYQHIAQPFELLKPIVLQAIEHGILKEKHKRHIASELLQSSTEFIEDDMHYIQLTLEGCWDTMLRLKFDERLSKLENFGSLVDVFGGTGKCIASRFCLSLSGSTRLYILDRISREDLKYRQSSTLGLLFQHDDKRRELQSVLSETFGLNFVVDVTEPNHFVAKVAGTPPPQGIERSLGDEALSFFKNCEDFSIMSDGVKAFAGMVAAVTASQALFVIIDEPEAFLHPALCTRLARELCKKAQETGRQLIVATHSAAFMQGCLQAAVDLNVVRLTYRNGLATSRVMENKDLVPLMRNPLHRSIGALNGIFYESVVVTEADSDRAFYEEINHRCIANGHQGGISECLFLNAQNWQTTKIIGPLRKLGIAAAAIIDVDIVCEEASTPFQLLLEAAGIPTATRHSLGNMRGQLRPRTDEDVKALKCMGLSSLQGDRRLEFEDFINQLAEYGVFVVPTGELESWLPHLHSQRPHKNQWLEKTFEAMGEDSEADSYVKPADDDVWQFMTKIRAWLHNPNRRGIPMS